MSGKEVGCRNECMEEVRVGVAGEQVGMSIATSSLGRRQHTRHIVQSLLTLPSSLACLLPTPLPSRCQYCPFYPQPGPHTDTLGWFTKRDRVLIAKQFKYVCLHKGDLNTFEWPVATPHVLFSTRLIINTLPKPLCLPWF